MPELKGQLFAPGAQATRAVSLDWDEGAGVLRVRGDDIAREVSGDAISVATGGWQGQAVFLTWSQDGQGWAVGITDHETVRALAALISASLARELENAIAASVRSGRRGRRSLVIAGILALLPLALLVSAFLLRGPILDLVLRRLPVSVDLRLGALVEGGLARSGQIVATGPAADGVQAIGARLVTAAGASPYEFRFVVVRDARVNAFAGPGGLVVVHTGLLGSSASAEEVAGVLAHEMTHVLRRHTMRQVLFRSGLWAALRLLFGAPDGAAAVLSGAALDLTTLRFSREQESEADRGALELLGRARLSRSGLARFLERLGREGGGPPAWLSSHPAAAERALALAVPAESAPAPGAPESLDLDWWSIQAEAKAQETLAVGDAPDAAVTRR